MTKLRADGGAVVSLGKQLGSGGEGVVFHINEQPASVAKIYSEPLKPRQVAKLKAMVAVEDDPLRTVAAWPTAMLYAGSTPVGFTMPLVPAQPPRTVPQRALVVSHSHGAQFSACLCRAARTQRCHRRRELQQYRRLR